MVSKHEAQLDYISDQKHSRTCSQALNEKNNVPNERKETQQFEDIHEERKVIECSNTKRSLSFNLINFCDLNFDSLPIPTADGFRSEMSNFNNDMNNMDISEDMEINKKYELTNFGEFKGKKILNLFNNGQEKVDEEVSMNQENEWDEDFVDKSARDNEAKKKQLLQSGKLLKDSALNLSKMNISRIRMMTGDDDNPEENDFFDDNSKFSEIKNSKVSHDNNQIQSDKDTNNVQVGDVEELKDSFHKTSNKKDDAGWN